MTADAAAAPPATLVVFGASGDLTTRKLMPALASLEHKGLLPEAFTVVGVGRSPMSDADFAELMVEAVAANADGGNKDDGDGDAAASFAARAKRFRYVGGDYGDEATYTRLREVLRSLDTDEGTAGNVAFYLAIPPTVFGAVAEHLAGAGLNAPGEGGDFSRIVVEKPFGRDLESARALDLKLHEHFREDQIYRIDHYLGKETVQNLLALRFANAIFEPVWNRRYVDNVQITVAESVGVGHRAGFYEQAGALRDIVANHVLQVLALTIMEPPASIDASGIRDEKVKALRAIEIAAGDVADDVVRAQYTAGTIDGEAVPGYRDEPEVDPLSQTETFVAMKLEVDNWRWAGVPFYVRTGKRLPRRDTEVVLEFKDVPHLPFRASDARGLGPNRLILQIQPDEGITLCFGAKVPGQEFEVRSVTMDFTYAGTFTERSPDAYERLLLDALSGDPTLFIRSDEVQESWRVVDPILAAFESHDATLDTYPAGSWGPRSAHRLLERNGHAWYSP